jgi:electron transfer flavoprotein alpha subunit
LTTLVFLEHHDGELQKDSLGVLGKAAQLGDDVSALIAGSGVEALARTAAVYGARHVYVADDPALEAPRSSSGNRALTPSSFPRRC